MTRGLVNLAGAVALFAVACASPAAPGAVVLQATATPTPTATPVPTPTPTPTATPTPEPTPTPTPMPWMPAGAPQYCVAPERGVGIQEVLGTPAGPYFVRHPAADDPNAPLIVFLGGGSGQRRSAERVWANYLSKGAGVDDFRVALPYSVDIEFYDYYEAQRTFDVVEEVLACYGGDPQQVHLAGFSNGGHVAFDLILQRPALFATLLGAPGEFPQDSTPEQWSKALCGKAVFNGVGAWDDEWKPGVQAIHEGLSKVGVDSVYVEFAGQSHSLKPEFDETVFLDFWRAHGPGTAKAGCPP
ncbi:MAG: hypothetical protein HY681_15405 [Chloroflexi bacterium]|nr:hypothetical protein [Chloroflexota bacterium]